REDKALGQGQRSLPLSSLMQWDSHPWDPTCSWVLVAQPSPKLPQHKAGFL
ncbi:unnamed protein product, partial [Bubo scandiacus]